MAIYRIYCGATPTASKFAEVTLDVGVHTLLQVQASVSKPLKVVEWGISFSGFAAATGIPTELIETGTVFATVTAHVSAGIIPFDAEANAAAGDVITNLIRVGTAATGYDASAEGTVTESRLLDAQLIAPTNQFVKQFPLGREPYVHTGRCLRIRTDAAVAVDAICYVDVEV